MKRQQKKRPIAITLLLVWIGYMIFRGILKSINLERLELNKQILGKFAIINYWIDLGILIVFILIFICLIKRRANTWRYLIAIVVFLMIGTVIGQILSIILANKIIAISGQDLPRSVFLFSMIISSIILLVFYSFVIFETYKNRFYFTKSKSKTSHN